MRNNKLNLKQSKYLPLLKTYDSEGAASVPNNRSGGTHFDINELAHEL